VHGRVDFLCEVCADIRDGPADQFRAGRGDEYPALGLPDHVAASCMNQVLRHEPVSGHGGNPRFNPDAPHGQHTGTTLAAEQGASVRQLMERMGHSSPRAALINLDATREPDQATAAGMGLVLREAREKCNGSRALGTQRARRRKSPREDRLRGDQGELMADRRQARP
jgi:hypothetical protein